MGPLSRRSLALVAVCTIGACADAPRTETSIEPIIGGTSDSTDTAVVGILVEYASGGILTCSGSLIAPNLVLTARHCVAIVNGGGTIDCATSTFGATFATGSFFVTTDATFSMDAARYHSVSQVVTTSGTTFCGHDMALLVLATPFGADQAVPITPRVDSPVVAGETFDAIGYGGIDGMANGAGERRRRDGLMVGCVGTACMDSRLVVSEWRASGPLCEGDSGGPALDSQFRVIGVASRGGPNCIDSMYGAIAANADLITTTALMAASIGGYAPPGWARGWPTDPAHSGPVGAACTSDSSCLTTHCAPAGFCTRLCDSTVAPCPTGYECGAGGVCVRMPSVPDAGAPNDASAPADATRAGDAAPHDLGLVGTCACRVMGASRGPSLSVAFATLAIVAWRAGRRRACMARRSPDASRA